MNLQLVCDGPLAGLFVDADTDGNVRGYVRRPSVHFPGDPGRGARALGGSGFLSVVRQVGDGQHYRSAIELRALDLADDLRRWFAASEQVATALDLAVVPSGDEPLGEVAGVLVQRPDGDDAAIDAAGGRLAAGALGAAVARGRRPRTCSARCAARASSCSRTARSPIGAAAARRGRGRPSRRSGATGCSRCSPPTRRR